MKKIVIIGGGGHAKVIASILKKLNTFEVLGYTDTNDCGLLLGFQYLGADTILSSLRTRYSACSAVIGVGYLGKGNIREQIVERLGIFGFELPAIISPGALINEEVEVGDGTVIMDGAVINSGTRIGRYCIINTRASIDHDCTIGDLTHIAPGVVLSGGVNVGARTLIGVGASVVQYKNISESCIIGAGAVVVTDCLDNGTYLGVPAKKVNIV